jgi:hypothetical protein
LLSPLHGSIFDRLKPDGPNGDGTDRVQAHLADAAIFLVADGSFTEAQARSAINAHLETPLAGAELSELNQVLTNIQAEPTLTDKIRYSMRWGHIVMVVESGDLTSEAIFKSVLNIP